MTPIAAALILTTCCPIMADAVEAPVSTTSSSKNWTAPPGKLYVQELTSRVMASHPELLSVTFHGVPPGAPAKTYTMFGGSYPDRIGNRDDPDDVMVLETGVTILDPRWHRTKDAVRKFVVQLPLRDSAGENIGLLVLAYKNSSDKKVSDETFLAMANHLRDDLKARIPTLMALFNTVH